jgi:hypothetical protein
MWKVLHDKVDGTSHRASGAPCQDAYFASRFRRDDGEYVVLVCSDGAGSASESHVGSQVACDTVAGRAAAFLQGGGDLRAVDRTTLLDWLAAAHEAIVSAAEGLAVAPRELACTVAVAVVGPGAAAFAQVGDGAIVISEGDAYRPVFWPATGEYQNTTFFLSEPNYQDNVQSEVMLVDVAEVALFTDGLQMLALNYASRTAHAPFFRPMFQALRGAADVADLMVPLRQFLDSPAVNARTDDDKTLILASRTGDGANAA